MLVSNVSAFVILCHASAHRVALEPCIGPYRPQTRYLDWFIRLVRFDVLFWFIKDLLGIGNEVPSFIVTGISYFLTNIHVHLAVL